MWWKILLIVLILALVGWTATMTILSTSARRPDNLGVHDGKLAPCPTTPNCVFSQGDDDVHRMAPILFDGDADEALARLEAVVGSLPRTAIVSVDGDYVHAESTSLLFRFVDDVEFLVDRGAKVIHFRSASRVGRSDFGVNRKRMEEIRNTFDLLAPTPPR